MGVNVNRQLGRIKSLYSRAVNKNPSAGRKALEKGKLLERVVRLYLKEKGYPASRIAGSTHGIPDVTSPISAKRVVLTSSTLYLENSVFECCNLKKGGWYRMPYMKNLYKRLDQYFEEQKVVYLVCSYKTIFRGELKELEDLKWKKPFFIVELGFQVTINNLNRTLYEKIKKKLDRYLEGDGDEGYSK